jgi:hypothetical protein
VEQFFHNGPQARRGRKGTSVKGLGLNVELEDFPLTSNAARPNIQSHTGFGGCDAVESDSPMYITLANPGNAQMLTFG